MTFSEAKGWKVETIILSVALQWKSMFNIVKLAVCLHPFQACRLGLYNPSTTLYITASTPNVLKGHVVGISVCRLSNWFLIKQTKNTKHARNSRLKICRGTRLHPVNEEGWISLQQKKCTDVAWWNFPLVAIWVWRKIYDALHDFLHDFMISNGDQTTSYINLILCSTSRSGSILAKCPLSPSSVCWFCFTHLTIDTSWYIMIYHAGNLT